MNVVGREIVRGIVVGDKLWAACCSWVHEWRCWTGSRSTTTPPIRIAGGVYLLVPRRFKTHLASQMRNTLSYSLLHQLLSLRPPIPIRVTIGAEMVYWCIDGWKTLGEDARNFSSMSYGCAAYTSDQGVPIKLKNGPWNWVLCSYQVVVLAVGAE